MPTTSRRCKSKLSLLLASVTLAISATITAANTSDKTISLDPGSVNRATQAESKLKLLGEHNLRTPSSLEPSYPRIARYTTTVSADGDPADIYYPVVPKPARVKFPIVLLLQGALVDKADYANFATQVARYGFIIVVPIIKGRLQLQPDRRSRGYFPNSSRLIRC
jgi:predicted dienelactone hydrolase